MRHGRDDYNAWVNQIFQEIEERNASAREQELFARIGEAGVSDTEL
jgi:hypothetical protein